MRTFELKMRIGGREYKAEWEDNVATRALKKLLPLKIEMEDKDREEKFYYFEEESFPKEERQPEKIEAGDVLLFEDNCLVIFYKDVHTSYRYTNIGKILEPKDLAKALAGSKVEVEIREN